MAANSILARPHNTITSSQQGAKRNPHNSDQRQPLDISRLDLRTHRNPSTRPTPDLRRGTDIRHSPRRNPTGDGTTSPSRIRLPVQAEFTWGQQLLSQQSLTVLAPLTSPPTPATTWSLRLAKTARWRGSSCRCRCGRTASSTPLMRADPWMSWGRRKTSG